MIYSESCLKRFVSQTLDGLVSSVSSVPFLCRKNLLNLLVTTVIKVLMTIECAMCMKFLSIHTEFTLQRPKASLIVPYRVGQNFQNPPRHKTLRVPQGAICEATNAVVGCKPTFSLVQNLISS